MDSSFSEDVYSLILRYKAMESTGLHASILPEVMQFLIDKFGVTVECFASPFNHYLTQVVDLLKMLCLLINEYSFISNCLY